ncbi:uncharacterized protein LOC102709962 [Oryza brachyantha]|uniref:uncharacterized protein LOC102709962 n=1 Tax=Oryza brachyantha TaxID=4533 RepID=UPI001ADB7795|nr:uncharacterized protein LOC102709962 [Oryza brachyantha]
MANPTPPCVLMNRIVFFVGDTLDDGTSRDTAGMPIGWSKARALSPREAMEAMEPITFLAEPPEVSYLQMRSPTPAHALQMGSVDRGDVSGTHKGIVVIYADFYRPGCCNLHGCYLLYDASKPNNGDALTVIPQLPDSRSDPTLVYLGNSAVLVTDPRSAAGDDDYILADIVTSPGPELVGRGLPEATIFTWSSAAGGGEWIRSSIPQLPLPAHLCGPNQMFQIDRTFSLDSGRICWVDLLQGILFCDDLLAPEGPKLGFIPLPAGCCSDVHHKLRHQKMPSVHRSIVCVSGVIKFVALFGCGRDFRTPAEAMLKTWALSPDFKEWEEDTRALSIADIWASESFNQMGLPHVIPVSPVLSITEDGVMYAVLNDIERVPAQIDDFGNVVRRGHLVPKANYMIRFDINQNKVLSSTKLSEPASLSWTTPNFFATDFTAYLSDHKRAEDETGKVGARAKGKRKQMEY